MALTSASAAAAKFVDVGPGMQAKAAEQSPLAAAQVPVGQVKRCRDRYILGAHQVQAVPCGGEFRGESGRCPGGMMMQLAGEHPDSQRQVAAEPGELRYHRVIDAQPRPT